MDGRRDRGPKHTPRNGTLDEILVDWEEFRATRGQLGAAFVRILGYFREDGTKSVAARSEEHTSELQSLMRISYAVFCLKKTKILRVLPIHLTFSQCYHHTPHQCITPTSHLAHFTSDSHL